MRKHPRWLLGNYLRQFPQSKGTAQSFRRPFGKQDVAREDFFTESVDTTAPSLSSASATASSHVAYTGAVTTDEANGTLYYYISTNSTETGATVKASGATQVVSATGVQNVSGGGLTPATGYYLHFLHRDTAGNDSTVLSTSQFFTALQLFARSTQTNGITSGGVACYDLLTTEGASADTGVVTATASGTDNQWTKTAGGSILVFATGRVPSGGWTFTNSDLAIWAQESIDTVNAGLRVRFYKWASGTETLIGGSPFDDGVELSTSPTLMQWVGNVTDTALVEDERLLAKFYLTNVGTMGAGTATIHFNSGTLNNTVTPAGTAQTNHILASNHTANNFNATIDATADYVSILLSWTGGTLRTVSAITYGGIAPALVAGTNNNNNHGGIQNGRAYYELSAADCPGGVLPTGTVASALTMSGGVDTSQVVIRAFKGCAQVTSSEGGNATGTQTNAGPTTATVAPTTTTVSGDYLIGTLIVGAGDTAVSTSDTQLFESYDSNLNITINAAEQALAGSGQALNWTVPAFCDWAAACYVIKAGSVTPNSYINVYPAVTFKAEGGGGSTNLVLGDASHAHTADNVVLTSSTALSINDASHGHSSDNLTLSTGTALDIAESAHPHLADNVTLSTGTALAIADALHSHSADNLILTTQSSLIIGDALHAQTADNLALTSQHALVVNDALHGHAADNLTISSGISLSITDAVHAHSADNLILTSQLSLAIAEALHGHTGDSLVLSTATALLIADALHAHSVDNLSLTSQLTLIVNEALHGHVADNVTLGTTGSINLTIAEALHGHTADNLALTSQLSLSIAEALHAHSVDNLALSTQIMLIVADALHAHAAEIVTLGLTGSIDLIVSDALHAQLADNVTLSTQLSLLIADALHIHAADNLLLTIDDAAPIEINPDIRNRAIADLVYNRLISYGDGGDVFIKVALRKKMHRGRI
jgi:hypothetical protein